MDLGLVTLVMPMQEASVISSNPLWPPSLLPPLVVWLAPFYFNSNINTKVRTNAKIGATPQTVKKRFTLLLLKVS